LVELDAENVPRYVTRGAINLDLQNQLAITYLNFSSFAHSREPTIYVSEKLFGPNGVGKIPKTRNKAKLNSALAVAELQTRAEIAYQVEMAKGFKQGYHGGDQPIDNESFYSFAALRVAGAINNINGSNKRKVQTIFTQDRVETPLDLMNQLRAYEAKARFINQEIKDTEFEDKSTQGKYTRLAKKVFQRELGKFGLYLVALDAFASSNKGSNYEELPYEGKTTEGTVKIQKAVEGMVQEYKIKFQELKTGNFFAKK